MHRLEPDDRALLAMRYGFNANELALRALGPARFLPRLGPALTPVRPGVTVMINGRTIHKAQLRGGAATTAASSRPAGRWS
jgi:hypothetical protein